MRLVLRGPSVCVEAEAHCADESMPVVRTTLISVTTPSDCRVTPSAMNCVDEGEYLWIWRELPIEDNVAIWMLHVLYVLYVRRVSSRHLLVKSLQPTAHHPLHNQTSHVTAVLEAVRSFLVHALAKMVLSGMHTWLQPHHYVHQMCQNAMCSIVCPSTPTSTRSDVTCASESSCVPLAPNTLQGYNATLILLR